MKDFQILRFARATLYWSVIVVIFVTLYLPWKLIRFVCGLLGIPLSGNRKRNMSDVAIEFQTPSPGSLRLLILSEEAFDREIHSKPRPDIVTTLEALAVNVKDYSLGHCIEAYTGVLDDHDADVGPYSTSERAKGLTTLAPTFVWFVFTDKEASRLKKTIGRVRISDEDIKSYFNESPDAVTEVRATHELFKQALTNVNAGQVMLLGASQ